MKLYLMRHAQAEYGPQLDPTRKLTPTGKDQARMMAKWLARQIEKPDLVLQSNMHRSKSTAKRMAKKLDAPIITTFRLDPDGSPEAAWREIRKQAALNSKCKCVLAVTHGPLIEKILAMLIGAPTASNIHFAHAAIAHFDTIKTVQPIEEADYSYDEREVKRLVLGSGGASGVNCDYCEEAADRGWIDMDDVFAGPGEDADEPPLHPNCDCEIEYKTQRFRVYESGRREALNDEGPFAFFHWLVTPNTVARDEEEQDIVTEAALCVAEAAAELIDS